MWFKKMYALKPNKWSKTSRDKLDFEKIKKNLTFFQFYHSIQL